MGGKAKVKNTRTSGERQKTVGPETTQRRAEPEPTLNLPLFTDRSELLTFLLIALTTQTIYHLTMYPSMAGGDSGELLTVAVEFGVAHPPGYPLLTLLGWTWNKLLFLGTPAWKLNLLSAILSGLSNGVIYLVVHQVTYNNAAAVLTSLWCGFSRLFWAWSIQYEVFSLNNLLTGGILLTMVRFGKVKERNVKVKERNLAELVRAGKVCAVMCGIAMSNQHTCVLIIIPGAMWVLSVLLRAGVTDLRTLANISLHGFAGLLLYLQIPLSAWVGSARQTFGDQSSVLSSLSTLKRHVLREHYGSFALTAKKIQPDVLYNITCWFTLCRAEFTLALCVIAVLTVILTCKREYVTPYVREVVQLLLAMLIVYMGVFCSLANLPKQSGIEHGVLERFWMTPNLLLLVIAGIGLGTVCNRVKERCGRRWSFISLPLLLLLASWQLQRNYDITDQSTNTVYSNYGDHVLQHAPPDSVIVALGDSYINTLWYHIYAQNTRTDLCPITPVWLGWYSTSWYYAWLLPRICPGIIAKKRAPGDTVFDYKTFIDDNFDRRPILICGVLRDVLVQAIRGHYELWPWGLCIRIVRVSDRQDFLQYFSSEMPLTDLVRTPLPCQQRYTEHYMWERAYIKYMMVMLTKPGERLHYLAMIETVPDKQRLMFQTEIEYWQRYARTMYNTTPLLGHRDMRLRIHSGLAQACMLLYTLTTDVQSKPGLETCVREHFQIYVDNEPKGGDEPDTFVYPENEQVLKKAKEILGLKDLSKLTITVQ